MSLIDVRNERRRITPRDAREPSSIRPGGRELARWIVVPVMAVCSSAGGRTPIELVAGSTNVGNVMCATKRVGEKNMTVGSNNESKSSARGSRIVAGIDGSPASLLALKWAARQAELTGATLEVVAAWEWPQNFGWGVIPEGFDPAGDAEKILQPILASLHAEHPNLELVHKVVEGHPAPVLVAESRDADLSNTAMFC